MMIKKNPLLYFSVIAFMYCLLMGLFFQPITWQAQGDAQAYILLAKQILKISTDTIDLSGRQPLYSILLAIFIVLFGEAGFIYPVMYFQFLLIFVSSILVFKIFAKFSKTAYLPWFTGLAYLINLSTIYYGFSLLSETLSLFIFVSIVYFLILTSGKEKIYAIILLGVLNGLMVLARFNAIGIPIITLICLLLIHYKNHKTSEFRGLLKTLLFYLIPLILVLNLWCGYNYINRGFYGLFPSYHAGQRWAIPATINENNTVSDPYKPVLEIFLNARQEYLKTVPLMAGSKGSLIENKYLGQFYVALKPKINGYTVYKTALKDLLIYYNLENNPKDIAKLNELLKPFFNAISQQNASELLYSRIFSFISTFRASGVVLPGKEKINLNILPDFVLKAYKVIFMGISGMTYLVSGIYLLVNISKISKGADLKLIMIILLIWYFPLINFYANVLWDAHRFKFPAEPLILGLFIFFTYEIYQHSLKLYLKL